MKHVVILGAGYAGLKVVHELQKRVIGDVKLTLVDRNNYHYEATDLHEVAAGTKKPSDISYPIADVVKPSVTTFIQDEVTALDLANQTVKLADHKDLTYDYLVCALGFVSESFGIPGVDEHALPMATLKEAEAIHQHLLAMMDKYQEVQDPSYLNIVIGGAGFTGIELVGALNDARKTLADRAGVQPSDIKINVIEASTHLLPMFSEKLATYGINLVKSFGVNLVTGARITKVDDGQVEFQQGDPEDAVTSTMEAKTIIWTTGVSGSPIIDEAGFSARRGRVIPSEHLTDNDHDNVYLIGDVAAVMPPDGNRPYPTTAQIALGMGKYVANDLASRLTNGQHLTTPFTYKSLGTVASVGNTHAFGEAMGHEVRGYMASATKKMIANESLFRVGGFREVMKKGRFDLYH